MHRPRKHTLFLFVLQKVGAYTNSPFRQRHRTGLQSPPPVLPSLAPAELGLPWLPRCPALVLLNPRKKQIRWRWSCRRFGGPPRDQPRWTIRAQVTTLARQCLAIARASISRLSLLTPTGSCTHDPSRGRMRPQLTFRRDLYHTLQGRESG